MFIAYLQPEIQSAIDQLLPTPTHQRAVVRFSFMWAAYFCYILVAVFQRLSEHSNIFIQREERTGSGDACRQQKKNQGHTEIM